MPSMTGGGGSRMPDAARFVLGVASFGAVGAYATAVLRRLRRSRAARLRLRELLEDVVGEDARIVITGANSGIGKELADQFAKHPSVTLLLGCRHVEEQAQGKHKVLPLELLDFNSVERFAKEAHEFLAGGKRGLRLLVNNAGVRNPEDVKLPTGVRPTWQTNFLGPFLLTELLARLREMARVSHPLRVVNVSSGRERDSALDENSLEEVSNGGKFDSEYEDSKRAVMLWTSVRAQTLAFKGNLFLHTATPGVVDTRLGHYWVPAWLWPLTAPIRYLRLRSPAEGALDEVAVGLRKQATSNFGRHNAGEKQLEDLVVWRRPDKHLATKLVAWASRTTALDARAGGRPIGSDGKPLSNTDLQALAQPSEEDQWSTPERRWKAKSQATAAAKAGCAVAGGG